MSWLFSQALVAEYSPGRFWDGAPYAQLNVIHTAQPFSHKGKTTAFSTPSQYGLTCAPLTEDHGAALLTWCLAVSRARTSARRGPEPESRVSNLDSGWRWPGSFAKYDPATSSWKTRQSSLVEGSDGYSATWPNWGSMRNGECLALTTPGHLTSATEYGLWQPWGTPTARDWRDAGNCSNVPDNGLLGRMAKRWLGETELTGSLNPDFHLWLMGWPEGWTDLKPLETGKYQRWLDSHGEP